MEAKGIFISRNGNQEGPFTIEEIYSLLASNELSDTDSAWRDGLTEWSPLYKLLAEVEETSSNNSVRKKYVQPHQEATTTGKGNYPVHRMQGVNDLLLVYKDRLIIRPEGVMGLLSKGLKGEKTIPFHSITAIQFKRAGITTGYLQFTIPGGNESRGGIIDAGSDENTFMFYSELNKGDHGNRKAEEIKNYIEKQIREIRTPQPFSSSSLGDELTKIAALKSQGLLTDEEFQAAKKRLIG